jgi:hydroxyacylglutathione hydrolase
MNLIPLPAFSDNYIWLLQHQGLALVVDPGDSTAVSNWLAENNHQLDCILVTHHHGDHTGGVAKLQQEWGAKVYGPANEKLPFEYQALAQGQQFNWCDLNFQTLDVPGHTAGHIAYFAEPEGQDPLLFCGDTLFSGGCGRLFEGTATQMLDSLDILAALPGTSRVCCAHEYTLSNLKFARAVEPDNLNLQNYVLHCQTLRAQNLPTLPAKLGMELEINPFLRTRKPSVIGAVKSYAPQVTDNEADIFAHLRIWKNDYK